MNCAKCQASKLEGFGAEFPIILYLMVVGCECNLLINQWEEDSEKVDAELMIVIWVPKLLSK